MVRNYKRTPGSRNYKDYTATTLAKAVEKVKLKQCSILEASKEFQIPYGTLHNKINRKHICNTGGQTVFSMKEETIIIQAITKCAEWGFPLTLLDLRMFAKNYLDKKGCQIKIFKNNLPGRDWAYNLLKRHKSAIGQRMTSNITRARASVSVENLNTFYNNLEGTIEGVPSSHIFNYDETNVSDDPSKKKYLYRRGVKYPEKIMNHSKSCTTLMICGSASGILLPPYVLFRGQNLWDTWIKNGPKGVPCCPSPCCSLGTRYNRTMHGWMDAQCFMDWFITCFLPHARRLEGRKVLIGDNLSSHFSDDVLAQCEEYNISFVCLPPNSTHLTQPLDVAFFRPFKIAWRDTLNSWKCQNPKESTIPKASFGALLDEALKCMNNKKDNLATNSNQNVEEKAIFRNLVSGFEATGIYPLNRQRVLDRLPCDNALTVEDISTSLLEFLKEKRFGQGSKILRKKKKLCVEPGKSVSRRQDLSESSDSDVLIPDNSNSSTGSDDLENENFDLDNSVEYEQPTDINLKVGTFVLVKFMSGSRKSVIFKYVGVVQEKINEEFKIMGFKSMDTAKIIFKANDDDIFTVARQDILAILPDPVIIQGGDRVRFKFSFPIDVKET